MSMTDQVDRTAPKVSVIIPFYDEEDNILPVIREVAEVLDTTGHVWEIIAVDDGSRDATLARLLSVQAKVPGLRVLRMRRNSGQTAAMQAGFTACRGVVTITMDGDGQNDPAPIPDLLKKVDEGYDLVCGWRRKRQDHFWTRRLPSRIANRLIAVVTGVPIRDNGCSLKAYRTDLLHRIRFYGEQHRFIPALANRLGARITEMPVPHRARQFGESKYGLARTYRVLFDLVSVRFLRSLASYPLVPFLVSGLLALAAALAPAALAVAEYARGSRSIVVWSGATILLAYLGGYLLVLGFVAELVRQKSGVAPPGPVSALRGRLLGPGPTGGTPLRDGP
jgi:glycosyltransferase involved in cell wall biosynthesis